jgi:GNAT superfamily N-acetyltransferase
VSILVDVVHWFKELPSDYSDLTATIGVIGLLIITREVGQSWLLLARSLPRHGRMPRSLQAAAILVPLLWRGVQARSFYKAARLRIEIELLQPLPVRPLSLDHRNSHSAAIEKWKKDKKAWSKDTNALLAELVGEAEAARTIDVDNCSELLENPDVIRYFDALTRQRLGRSREPVFQSKVAFRSGFVAPLHLITGVLARYEDDWEPVIEGYGSSVTRSGDRFRYSTARELQAFIFDCWFLWGPSIPVCTCPEWHGDVALQYGFGDEDNSLILRCPSPQIVRLLGEEAGPLVESTPPRTSAPAAQESAQPQESEQSSPPPVARRARVSGTLKWGPALSAAGICPAQRAIWNDKRLVLDITGGGRADSIRVAGGTEEQVFTRYYSAYLWIAFVMCKSDNNEPDKDEPDNPHHKWRDLIPFFTHANIAAGETYEFYVDQLARSALEGVLSMLRAESELVLRFACAVDETGCGYELLNAQPTKTIRKKMTEFALKAEADSDNASALCRLRLGETDQPAPPFMDGDYSACALPGIVNDYRDEIKDETLTFHELRWSHRADRKLLKRFYKDCLVPEVSNSDERDSFKHIGKNLRQKEKRSYAKKKNNYHVVVVVDDGDVLVGGAIADYLFEPNAGMIEYLLIQPDYRARGVGRQLLEFTECLLHDDADKMRRLFDVDHAGKLVAQHKHRGVKRTQAHEVVKRHSALDWIVAELDDPYLTSLRPNEFDPFARARVWHNWDYRVLDFPYVQPALDNTRRPVTNLLLMAKICRNSRLADQSDRRGHSAPPKRERQPIACEDVATLVAEYQDFGMPKAPDRQEQPAIKSDLVAACPRLEPAEAPTKEAWEEPTLDLISFDEYLGWEQEKHLHVSEVFNRSDPELQNVIEVYKKVFTDSDIAIASKEFERAFDPGGLGRRPRYRYHLWALRRDVNEKECVGMASFLTMPSAGFSAYLGFVESVRGQKLLRPLVARIEEQMVRDRVAASAEEPGRLQKLLDPILAHFEEEVVCDRVAGSAEKQMVRNREAAAAEEPGWGQKLLRRIVFRLDTVAFRIDAFVARADQFVARVKKPLVRLHLLAPPKVDEQRDGWYVECDGEAARDTCLKLGFWELDVKYRQPCLPGKSDEPLSRCLHLMYKTYGRVYETDEKKIPKAAFLEAVREIYASIYGINDPNNETLCELSESLEETIAAK